MIFATAHEKSVDRSLRRLRRHTRKSRLQPYRESKMSPVLF